VFHQHGVIRTDTLEEMFDVATLLVNQPVPKGNRVAIVTNAGGLGIQCADTARPAFAPVRSRDGRLARVEPPMRPRSNP
jgi:acyl-CoA synthetase (NDP forming)